MNRIIDLCSCLLKDFYCNGLGILLFFSNAIIAIAIDFTHPSKFQRLRLNAADGTSTQGYHGKRTQLK